MYARLTTFHNFGMIKHMFSKFLIYWQFHVFRMSGVGIGTTIYNLRKQIQEIRSELNSITAFEPSPELIDSANLLRSNQYLDKKIQKQTQLIEAYLEYSMALEGMLSTLFEIQNDLKDVLKDQLSLLSSQRKKKK